MFLRYFSAILFTSVLSPNHAEILEMQCEFIELTDRGLSCEFNNIFTFDTSNINIIETNTSIEAIAFRQSELFKVPQDIFIKFPFLKHLDVEITQLKVIEADNFRSAGELKYFLARFNDVTRLDDEIFVLAPKLKLIALTNNRISSIQPKAFKGLNNLEVLFLDNNQITSLPEQLLYELPNLFKFSIASNNLTEIPNDFFTKTTKLEVLNLAHNLLTYFNDTHFDSLPDLENLRLDHNYLNKLDLVACKSTEINVEENDLEVIALNKWTKVVHALGNPVKKLILHEHYGAGRSYDLSFASVIEIVFFVHEHCCTIENLENFTTLMNSFGDLSKKNLNSNEWMCVFMKNIGYETPNGFVVNNVCMKINHGTVKNFVEEEVHSTSESVRFESKMDSNGYEESSLSPSTARENYFQESSTTEEIADVEEITTTTTEKTLWKAFKSTASDWYKTSKNKTSEVWGDVKNKTKGWWSG